MKTLTLGLAALLVSTSVYAQGATGMAMDKGSAGGAKAGMSSSEGTKGGMDARGGSASRGMDSKGADRSADKGMDRGSEKTGGQAARGAERSGEGMKAGRDRTDRGKNRRDAASLRERGDRGTRIDHRESRRTERTDVTTRVDGGFRREGRFVFIGGRRVVYGSPEYRRLVVTERRGGSRYVTVRGQRVVYGSPEYRRLVSVRETTESPRYVVIHGRRVVYGSPEYRRLTVTERSGGSVTVGTSERTRTHVSTRTGEHGFRSEARDQSHRGGAMKTGMDKSGTDRGNGRAGAQAMDKGRMNGGADKAGGGIRNASDRGDTGATSRTVSDRSGNAGGGMKGGLESGKGSGRN